MYHQTILYTSQRIIDLEGYNYWYDLVANGQLEWVSDDTYGNKLYKIYN